MEKTPETPEELLEWCRTLQEDGENLRRAHEHRWWENIAVYSGDLWAEYNPASRRLEEVAAPEHRVRLAINLSQPVVRTEYAKILKNRPMVDIVAGSTDKKDLNSAEVGDKILNNYVEKHHLMPRVRRQAVMWCLLTGLGSIFSDYDENKLGTTELPMNGDQPVVDPREIEALQAMHEERGTDMETGVIPVGEVDPKALSPFQLVWDFSKMRPEDGNWVIVSETYDVCDVKRRWGKEIEPDSNVRPNTLENRMLHRIDLTNKLDFNNLNAQDLAVVHRLFIKPGYEYFQDGGEIVFTKNELISAQKYPYAHGELPVSTMGHVPFPVSRYPLSVIDQIKDPVLELSKTQSQLIENRNLIGNPPWLEYNIHGIPEDGIQNRPGLRIKVDWRPGVPDPHPVEMPEMPGYIQNLPQTLREHILEISGQGETSQGRVPAGARSGVAIAYLQEEDDTKLGPTIQEFEEMIERSSWQILQNIAQFYQLPRTVQIFKRHSEPEVIDFIGTMLQGIAGIEVQAGSALPRSKAAKQQFMFDLWDRGVLTDPRQLMEMLELTQGDPLEWEYDIEQAERENSKLQQGTPVNVEPWYNHQAHQMIHRRFMKSADFEALDGRVQQTFRDHDELHTKAMQNEMLKAAAMGAVTGGAGGPMPPPMNGAPTVANGMNNQAPMQGGQFGSQIPAPMTEAQPQ
jgi:hypothetical protein